MSDDHVLQNKQPNKQVILMNKYTYSGAEKINIAESIKKKKKQDFLEVPRNL